MSEHAPRTIGFVGSREYPHRWLVENAVSSVIERFDNVTILSGGARGVDTWAVEYAKRRHCATHVIPALWEKHGKSAGYKRNVQIVESSDLVVAFWDEVSKGTKHTIDIAAKDGTPIIVFGADATCIYDTASSPTVSVTVIEGQYGG